MNGRLVKKQGSETCLPPTQHSNAISPSLYPAFFSALGLEACPRRQQDKSEAFSGPVSFTLATKGTR